MGSDWPVKSPYRKVANLRRIELSAAEERSVMTRPPNRSPIVIFPAHLGHKRPYRKVASYG
jgi:hypothetical protein